MQETPSRTGAGSVICPPSSASVENGKRGLQQVRSPTDPFKIVDVSISLQPYSKDEQRYFHGYTLTEHWEEPTAPIGVRDWRIYPCVPGESVIVPVHQGIEPSGTNTRLSGKLNPHSSANDMAPDALTLQESEHYAGNIDTCTFPSVRNKFVVQKLCGISHHDAGMIKIFSGRLQCLDIFCVGLEEDRVVTFDCLEFWTVAEAGFCEINSQSPMISLF